MTEETFDYNKDLEELGFRADAFLRSKNPRFIHDDDGGEEPPFGDEEIL
jgi:hypothetical protein